MHTHPRDQRPLIIDILLAIALFATILLHTQGTAGAAEIAAAPSFASVTGQSGDSHLTTGDLGVANAFVTSATVVNTPDRKLAGIDGIQQYLESLETRYPDASFQVTDIRTVNTLLIVDWHGTVEGTLVFPGRTLITIDDGAITDIWFLNLNDVSPAGGETFIAAAHVTAPVSVSYELPYEQGRPVVVNQAEADHVAASFEARLVDEQGMVTVPEQPLTVSGAAPESFATDADQDVR